MHAHATDTHTPAHSAVHPHTHRTRSAARRRRHWESPGTVDTARERTPDRLRRPRARGRGRPRPPMHPRMRMPEHMHAHATHVRARPRSPPPPTHVHARPGSAPPPRSRTGTRHTRDRRRATPPSAAAAVANGPDAASLSRLCSCALQFPAKCRRDALRKGGKGRKCLFRLLLPQKKSTVRRLLPFRHTAPHDDMNKRVHFNTSPCHMLLRDLSYEPWFSLVQHEPWFSLVQYEPWFSLVPYCKIVAAVTRDFVDAERAQANSARPSLASVIRA